MAGANRAKVGGMRCDNGHDNPPDMRFCGQCGQVLETEGLERPVGAGDPAPQQPVAPIFGGTGEAAPRIEQSETASVPPISAGGPAPKSKRGWIIAGVALGALAIVGGVIAVTAGGSDGATPIEDAAETCDLEENLGDNGSTISLDTEGEDDASGDDFAAVVCVLDALEMPDRVISQIDSTRALDGTQKASWGDYEAVWRYHPDNGLDLTIYVAE